MSDPAFEKGIRALAELALECEPDATPERRAKLEAAVAGRWTEDLVMRLARERGENVNTALARFRIEGRPF